MTLQISFMEGQCSHASPKTACAHPWTHPDLAREQVHADRKKMISSKEESTKSRTKKLDQNSSQVECLTLSMDRASLVLDNPISSQMTRRNKSAE